MFDKLSLRCLTYEALAIARLPWSVIDAFPGHGAARCLLLADENGFPISRTVVRLPGDSDDDLRKKIVEELRAVKAERQ
jgi:hypothetical protein